MFNLFPLKSNGFTDTYINKGIINYSNKIHSINNQKTARDAQTGLI